MRRHSPILLFSCSLFLYRSLVGVGVGADSNVGTEPAPKTWYLCVAGFDYYSFTYGFEAGISKACALFAGSKNTTGDNVIVISPDSAAYHVNNAIPGQLIYGARFVDDSLDNEYSKVDVTYNSQDITMDAFYGILSGNKTAVKGIGPEKVIESGPRDTIVLIFVSMGQYYGDIFLTNEQMLTAEKFIPFLEDLKEKEKFKQMLILIESHKAGSMFDGYLCTNCSIIAMTNGAAHDDVEVCWYNQELYAYTATCYMYYLLETLEMFIKHEELEKSTLFDLYLKSKEKSWHLEADSNLYGDLNLGNRKLSEFISSTSK